METKQDQDPVASSATTSPPAFQFTAPPMIGKYEDKPLPFLQPPASYADIVSAPIGKPKEPVAPVGIPIKTPVPAPAPAPKTARQRQSNPKKQQSNKAPPPPQQPKQSPPKAAPKAPSAKVAPPQNANRFEALNQPSKIAPTIAEQEKKVPIAKLNQASKFKFGPGVEITDDVVGRFKAALERAAEDYVPRLPEKAHEEFVRLFDKKPRILKTKLQDGNPHQILAAYRSMALYFSIHRILTVDPIMTLKNPCVDFVYGTTERDSAAIKYFNNQLVRAGFGTDQEPFLKHQTVGDQLTVDDFARRNKSAGATSKLAVLMDVYALGTSKLMPSEIARLGYQYWVWAGHCFDGPFGSYDSAIWCRDGIDLDQVWFKPDDISTPYPVHDACDIMHKSGQAPYGNSMVNWVVVHRYHWCERDHDRRVPVYSIVVGRVTDKEFIDLNSRAVSPINVVKLDVEVPLIHKWCPSIVTETLMKAGLTTKKKLLIRVDLYADLKAKCTARFYNQWSFGTLLNETDKYFNSLGWFRRLEMSFPSHFQHYRFYVATAIYTEAVEVRGYGLALMNQNYSTRMHNSNEQFSSIGKPTGINWIRWIKILSVFFGAGTLFVMLIKGFRKLFVPNVNNLFSDSLTNCMSNAKTIYSKVQAFPTFKEAVRKTFGYVSKEEIPREARLTIQALQARPFWKSLSQGLYKPIGWLQKLYLPSAKVVNKIDAIPNKVVSWTLMLVWMIFVSPAIEEVYKRLIPRSSIKASLLWKVISSFILANGDVYPALVDTRSFAISFVKHLVFAILPIQIGLPAHVANNTIASVLTTLTAFSCVGNQPCSLAKFRGRTCNDSRSVVSNNNVATLTEYRQLMSEDPITAMQPELLDFDLEKESYVPPANCRPKWPDMLDTSVTCNFKDLDKFDDATVVPSVNNGYYQWFAVNVIQYRPAVNEYNTRMMLMNRLLKAPPRWTPLNYSKTSFVKICNRSIIVCDPAPVYDYSSAWEICLCAAQNSVDLDWVEFDIRDLRFQIRSDHEESGNICEHFDWRPKYVDPVPLSIDSNLYDTDEEYREWLHHVEGSKKRMYKQEYDEHLSKVEVYVDDQFVTSMETSEKSNETLIKRDAVPRPIHRVDRTLCVFLGSQVYLATKKLYERHTFLPFSSKNGVIVTLTFGSAYNSKQLSEWFDEAIAYSRTCPNSDTVKHYFHVIVAGDDVLVISKAYDTELFKVIEGDISQCDHSIRLAALEFEWSMLYMYGVSPHRLNILSANSRSNLVVRNNKSELLVTVRRGHERNTGGVDTTVGNSLCVGYAWMYTLHKIATRKYTRPIDHNIESGIITHLSYKFGMSVKTQIHDNSTSDCHANFSGTFLKGAWWHARVSQYQNIFEDDTDGCETWWGPLPSRLIKLSKVMTKPSVIYRQLLKDHKESKHPGFGMSLIESWLCAISMVKSMRMFVLIPPIYQWFDALIKDYNLLRTLPGNEWLPTVDEIQSRQEDIKEIYKPNGFKICPRDFLDFCPCWVDKFAKRYDCSTDDVLSWSEQLQKIRPGTFAVHPVWEKLAQTDYA